MHVYVNISMHIYIYTCVQVVVCVCVKPVISYGFWCNNLTRAGGWSVNQKSPANKDASDFTVTWSQDAGMTYLLQCSRGYFCWKTKLLSNARFQGHVLRWHRISENGKRLSREPPRWSYSHFLTWSTCLIYIPHQPTNLSSVFGVNSLTCDHRRSASCRSTSGYRPLRWIAECPIGTIWIWHG